MPSWFKSRRLSLGSGKDRQSIERPSDSSEPTHVLEEESYGLLEWALGEDPTVDMVFIHGLNGHRERTWTASNGVAWPKQLLPQRFPYARILTFGYDSRTHATNALSQQTFHGHAITLLQKLSLYRRRTKTTQRPIIFVVHSLGGLVLKSDNLAHYRAIKLSTYGILFFGTPHQGGNGVGFGKILANLASLIILTNSGILDHVEKGSEWLEQQLDQYKFISSDIDTKFFYETIPTRLPTGKATLIVDKNSATVPGAVNAEAVEVHKTHSDMVKIKHDREDEFVTIESYLSIMCNEAPVKVERNWELEQKTNAKPFVSKDTKAIEDDFRLELSLGYKRNPIFSGRNESLVVLHELLLTTDTFKSTVVILGIGGLGKTQIVREYAYLYKDHYASIAWFDCHSLETIQASFINFAQRLVHHYAKRNHTAIPPYSSLAQHLDMVGAIDADGVVVVPQDKKNLIVRAVQRWFAQPRNSGWLAIYDNYDDISLEPFKSGELLPEATENGRILITTRRRECARFGQLLELGVMNQQEGLELLWKSSKKDKEMDREEGLAIVKALGYLPLAIDQAGAYIFSRDIPLSKYLPLLGGSDIKKIMTRIPSVGWQYQHSVFTTWEVSFQTIEMNSPKAAELLLLCAYFSNEDIQIEMLERGFQAIDEEAAHCLDSSIEELLSFSLIARKASGESFSIHPLVHAWAHERLDIQTQKTLAQKASLLIMESLRLTEIWTTGVRTPKDWSFERMIIPHIERVTEWLRKYWAKETTYFQHSQQWIRIANVYFYQGRYSDANNIYKEVVEARDSRFDADDVDTLTAVQAWATIKRFQGDWRRSEELYQRALACRKAKDPNHLDTLATVQSLAVLYRHQGRLGESVDLYDWALHGQDHCGWGIEEQQGPNHPNTIHTVLGLAIVFQKQGENLKSLELYERVLEQREQNLGEDHPDTLTVKQNLADVLRCLKRFDESEHIFGDLLDSRENQLGADNPDTLRTADSLANLYRDQGRFDKAERYYLQALEGRKARLGASHPDTLDTIHHIAENYRLKGQIETAKTLYEQALAGRESTSNIGTMHPDTLRTVEGLGYVAEAQRNYEEAATLFERALHGFETLYPNSPEVVRGLENMGRVSEKRGLREEATRYHRKLSAAEALKDDSSRRLYSP